VRRVSIVLLSLCVLLLLANCAPSTGVVNQATATVAESTAIPVVQIEEETPTATPTLTPTVEPTATPTAPPTKTPTNIPTDRPSPTSRTTLEPTNTPRPTKPAPRPTATPAKVELVLSEAELNEMIQKGMAGRSDVPVSDVYVRLIPDLLIISARARVGFFALNMEMVVAVSVGGGQAIPEIVEIKANGQPLSGFLKAQVDAMIAPYLDQWLQTETGVYVEQVVLTDGEIRVIGRYR